MVSERLTHAAANKRKKPLGIGRAARCQELPGLTRFRSPLNNALLPVMFRAAHIFATCGRASVRAGLAVDQSELFYTDGVFGAIERNGDYVSRAVLKSPRDQPS